MQAIQGLSLGGLAISRQQNGVMLLALMIFLTILGLVVAKTTEVWSTTLTREREQELLFVGEQYRKAIEKYYYATPGTKKVLPATLEELVQDDRFPKPMRHLRQLYQDPMQSDDTWGVMRQNSKIVGVYSLSDHKPIKKTGFETRYTDFSAAQSYRGWRFIFRVPGTQDSGSPLGGLNTAPMGPTSPTNSPIRPVS